MSFFLPKKRDYYDPSQVAKDPFEKAMAFKNRGNKYFQGGRYELAIKCYTSAIETCPSSKTSDLATFYQNRAAACELLVNWLTTNAKNTKKAKTCKRF